MNNQKITQTKIEQTPLEKQTIETKKGLKIHLAVTVIVSSALAAINMLTVPQFPWFLFPAIGMSAGVIVHYFGLRAHRKKDPN